MTSAGSQAAGPVRDQGAGIVSRGAPASAAARAPAGRRAGV
ncbi:MAG TPA: hypothetical protein VMK13_04125 [Streptosporangiaceae bacterium]|nr:hypothetical protein [Streptosporangiaceae bacterium]